MKFESPEEITKRAQQEINNRLDPDFEQKYQDVKPALDKYAEVKFIEENTKKAQALKERKEKENDQIEEIRQSLGATSEQARNTIGLELNMHSKEKINERAQNRINMIRGTIPKETLDQPWSAKAEEVLKQSGVEKRFPTEEAPVASPVEVLINEKVEDQKLGTPEGRARNVMSMIENGKLDTNEKKAKNLINFNERINALQQERSEKKNKIQQLVSWWKTLGERNN